jgi:probable HAF family extracellular repeat protein
MRRLAILFVFAFTTSVAAPAEAAVRYTCTDLGAPFSVGSDTYATDINASGQVVIELSSGSSFAGYVYSGGSVTNLTGVGNALAINASGQIVGSTTTPYGYRRAVLYSGGSMTALGGMSGNYHSEATAINDAGTIAGWWYNSSFLYRNGQFFGLGNIGGTNSHAYAINASDQVVGSATNASGRNHAFISSGGTMTNLGTLGGLSSEAYAINDIGQVVGVSDIDSGYSPHAFVYSGGSMTSLGTLGSAHTSFANDINNHGAIVGNSGSRAFLYEDGAIQDLNTLIAPLSGWTIRDAVAINDSGQIVGYASDSVGLSDHAFLLTPIPEPSTLLLAATGVMGMLFYFYRRHKGN